MTERIAYRPSNGTEGCIFEERFCDLCEHERLWREDDFANDACSIHTWALAVEISHPEYPQEWREDGPEGPRCTAFQEQSA